MVIEITSSSAGEAGENFADAVFAQSAACQARGRADASDKVALRC